MARWTNGQKIQVPDLEQSKTYAYMSICLYIYIHMCISIYMYLSPRNRWLVFPGNLYHGAASFGAREVRQCSNPIQQVYEQKAPVMGRAQYHAISQVSCIGFESNFADAAALIADATSASNLHCGTGDCSKTFSCRASSPHAYVLKECFYIRKY